VTQVDWRSTDAELFRAGRDAYAAGKTLSSVKAKAHSLGLGQERGMIMAAGWEDAHGNSNFVTRTELPCEPPPGNVRNEQIDELNDNIELINALVLEASLRIGPVVYHDALSDEDQLWHCWYLSKLFDLYGDRVEIYNTILTAEFDDDFYGFEMQADLRNVMAWQQGIVRQQDEIAPPSQVKNEDKRGGEAMPSSLRATLVKVLHPDRTPAQDERTKAIQMFNAWWTANGSKAA
jgi:hypothetical protein